MDQSPLPPGLSRADVRGGPFAETVRTLMEVLQSLTDLDSIFLARYDDQAKSQEIILAVNRHPERVNAVEGRVAHWPDTLCCHALADAIPYTQHADELWPWLPPVRQHGVRTYLTEPVCDPEGRLLGTLCGLDTRRVEIPANVLDIMARFARLIAHQLEREHRATALLESHARLASLATRDALTGVANRRGLANELNRALALAARDDGRVLVAFIDLDRFKDVNDRLGHRVGDLLLLAVAGRLTAAARAGELVARYGGDEFVVVARLARPQADDHAVRMAERLAAATRGCFELDTVCLNYAGASVGTAMAQPGETAEALLHRADRAMYARKSAAVERARGGEN